eukprot:1833808-Rhodomonas_salina.2
MIGYYRCRRGRVHHECSASAGKVDAPSSWAALCTRTRVHVQMYHYQVGIPSARTGPSHVTTAILC